MNQESGIWETTGRWTYISLAQEAKAESLKEAPLVRAEWKAPDNTVKCEKEVSQERHHKNSIRPKRGQFTLQSDLAQVREMEKEISQNKVQRELMAGKGHKPTS